MKRRIVHNLSITAGLLFAAGILFLMVDSVAAAAESKSLCDKTWTWGYVIEGELPADVPFVSSWSSRPKRFTHRGKSSCSLETAARYMRTPNVMFLNSLHDIEALNSKTLAPLASCERGRLRASEGEIRRIGRAGQRAFEEASQHYGRYYRRFHVFHKRRGTEGHIRGASSRRTRLSNCILFGMSFRS